jgi:hypothetical protein
VIPEATSRGRQGPSEDFLRDSIRVLLAPKLNAQELAIYRGKDLDQRFLQAWCAQTAPGLGAREMALVVKQLLRPSLGSSEAQCREDMALRLQAVLRGWGQQVPPSGWAAPVVGQIVDSQLSLATATRLIQVAIAAAGDMAQGRCMDAILSKAEGSFWQIGGALLALAPTVLPASRGSALESKRGIETKTSAPADAGQASKDLKGLNILVRTALKFAPKEQAERAVAALASTLGADRQAGKGALWMLRAAILEEGGANVVLLVCAYALGVEGGANAARDQFALSAAAGVHPAIAAAIEQGLALAEDPFSAYDLAANLGAAEREHRAGATLRVYTQGVRPALAEQLDRIHEAAAVPPTHKARLMFGLMTQAPGTLTQANVTVLRQRIVGYATTIAAAAGAAGQLDDLAKTLSQAYLACGKSLSEAIAVDVMKDAYSPVHCQAALDQLKAFYAQEALALPAQGLPGPLATRVSANLSLLTAGIAKEEALLKQPAPTRGITTLRQQMERVLPTPVFQLPVQGESRVRLDPFERS